jgi:hypothetical protein
MFSCTLIKIILPLSQNIVFSSLLFFVHIHSNIMYIDIHANYIYMMPNKSIITLTRCLDPFILEELEFT